MSYIDGFVIPVPTARREEYRAHEAKWWPQFWELGATSLAVGWGDDVPEGKQTDFQRAVAADGNASEAHYYLAVAQFRNGSQNHSLETFRVALRVAQLRRVRLCHAEQKLRRLRLGHAAAVVPVDDRARQKRRAVPERDTAERDDREQNERERDHERYERFLVSPFFRCRIFHGRSKPLRSIFIL